MTQSTKRRSLLFLSAALVSLSLLSGSLSNLQLQVGEPFPGADAHYAVQPARSRETRVYSLTVLQGLFDLILLLLMVYVPIRLLALVKLKWLVRWLFRLILLLVILLVLLAILSYLNLGPTGASEGTLEVTSSPSTGISTSPLGRPSKEILWVVAIGFVLAVGAFMIRRQRARGARREDPLMREANNAMQALRAGKDFRNVIINCYLQMTEMLREERGIERSNNMTAREFEDWLVSRGLPRLPVQRLTGLFEKVRYGAQRVSKNEEQMALESLSEIIHFSEGTNHG